MIGAARSFIYPESQDVWLQSPAASSSTSCLCKCTIKMRCSRSTCDTKHLKCGRHGNTFGLFGHQFVKQHDIIRKWEMKMNLTCIKWYHFLWNLKCGLFIWVRVSTCDRCFHKTHQTCKVPVLVVRLNQVRLHDVGNVGFTDFKSHVNTLVRLKSWCWAHRPRPLQYNWYQVCS